MHYPGLEIDRAVITNNIRETVLRCKQCGISVCGVIKACNGLPEIANLMTQNGCTQIATSRLSQVIRCKEAGIDAEYLMLRIPALSELDTLIRYCDMSLQSEWITMIHLEEACKRLRKIHKVIIMADLGDLREGIWSRSEFLETCENVEKKLKYVKLVGIGVNLGCYGAIKPTAEKMDELLSLAHEAESIIGHKLDIISGGATTSYTLVHWGKMPEGINHLRIGDNLLLSRGLQTNWNIKDMNYLQMTGFKLSAEVIEIKEKPSFPQGEFAFNSYGKLPAFENKGIRKRALLALGNADVGDVRELIPVISEIEIVGGSSDHMIIDVTNCREPIRIGSIIAFYPRYVNLLHATQSADVDVHFVN